MTVVFVFSSAASAASVNLQIIAGPDPQGTDPGSGAPSYLPGDTITIALVASGFGTGPTDGVALLYISSVTTDNGGAASNPQLHPKLIPDFIIAIAPAPGQLLGVVSASLSLGDYEGIDSGNLFWFDFQVPDLQHSEIITIDLTDLDIDNKFGTGLTYTYGGALEIHVTEPPCCPGDTDNDGDIDIDDFNRIKNDLAYANWLQTGGPPADPNYLILPDSPITGFLWDPCLDIIDDSRIDLYDFGKIKGDLTYASWLLTGGSPAYPNYMIRPGDPCVGFLWPCD